MFKLRTLSLAATAALLLAACTGTVTPTDSAAESANPAAVTATQDGQQAADTAQISATPGELTAAPELKEAHSVDDVDLAAAEDVTLDGTTASSSATGVSIDGNTVTITTGGTYRLTGTLSGQVRVDTTEKVALVLDGAKITATTGAAIEIVDADEATVYLAESSSNALQDAEGNDSGAALDSSADLSITGSGALTVVGTTNDGIASSDGLVIESGTVTVTAADDAIRGKDYLVITGGTISATADGGHALKSDNTDDATVGYVSISGGELSVESGEDGINAQTILISDGRLTIAAGDDGAHGDLYLGITGGTVLITQSEEGLEAAIIELAGGTIDIVASDDGINAASDLSTAGDWDADDDLWVSFSGAHVTVDAGGDGIDSNGNAYMSAGSLTINGPTSSGDGAIDVVGSFDVTGGDLIAAGSAGMAETPDASSAQSFVQVNASAQAGSAIELNDASGTTIVAFTTTKTTQNIVISTPQIAAGETYTLLVDGTSAGTAVAGQVAAGNGMGGGPGGGMPGGSRGPGGSSQSPDNGERPEFPGNGELPGDGEFPGGTAPQPPSGNA